MKEGWEVVIGLEIHAQLKTNSKLFSGAATQYGMPPNSQACAIDLALPGTLPVLNQEVIDLAIRFGLAISATIAHKTIFVRKNYFYPDLPKGYQISQLEDPIVGNGTMQIILPDGRNKTIRINRAHLEEDAGKSIHTQFPNASGIDFNRAGTPLLEIVSEPDLSSPVEAGIYMREIHGIVQHLDICDGNMQEGSFRCDANVSVRKVGQSELGTRTEIKNLNSFRFIEKAIEYELERQIEVIEKGGEITQETRLFDDSNGQTKTMRSKEESHDYQYFPDPDLLPVQISARQIEEVKKSMPELPRMKEQRYREDFDLNDDDITRLINHHKVALYFEQCIAAARHAKPQAVANWINGTLTGALKQDAITIEQSPVSANALAQILDLLATKKVSNNLAREIFARLWSQGGSVDEIMQQEGFQQSNDTIEIEKLIQALIEESPNQVAQYRAGKDKVLGFFVGRIMKETQGKVDPEQINKLLKKHLA